MVDGTELFAPAEVRDVLRPRRASVRPSVLPSLLLSLVASHSATLYKAATSLQRFVFFFLARMHMYEMKAEATRDDKQTSCAELECQYDKEGCKAGCIFFFFFFFLDSALKLFWQQLQNLESCCHAAPVGGLDDLTWEHRQVDFL